MINYITLTHDIFLNEIKKFYSLYIISINELKNICIYKLNYIFVYNNFIKMISILLNIE